MPQPKVLVTGATGFIGCHLCPSLIRKGYAVRGTYRRPEKIAGTAKTIEWIHLADMGPTTDWSRALTGVDYVIHLAGLAHQVGVSDKKLADTFKRINTDGTRSLARAAVQASVKRIVFVSSIAAIHGLTPSSAYGDSKKLGELAVQEELAGSSTDWCVVRPCLVYGSGNPGNMKRLVQLLNTGLPLPFASIKNQRRFLFVGNLVGALITCLDHPSARNGIFNVGDDAAVSTPELLTLISGYSGMQLRMFSLPVYWLRVLGRFGDLCRWVSPANIGIDSGAVSKLCDSLDIDCSYIQKATGWTPPCSMSEGLRRTFESGNEDL